MTRKTCQCGRCDVSHSDAVIYSPILVSVHCWGIPCFAYPASAGGSA